MTLVEVWLIDSKIKKMKVSGHANSDEYGKDIVCSSISTSVILTCNILTELCPRNIVKCDEKNAIIEIDVDLDNDSQVVINQLYKLLIDLKSQYPNYLKIKLN